jgi:uncharacterized protein YhfF
LSAAQSTAMLAPMDERADVYFVPKDARVQAFWRAFCRSAELSNDTDYQAWHFGDTRELADELIELVVRGQKRATAALGYLYDRNPSLEPVLYGYSVLTDFEGAPLAVIQTIQIERRAFRDVDEAFARIEGEGDGSLRCCIRRLDQPAWLFNELPASVLIRSQIALGILCASAITSSNARTVQSSSSWVMQSGGSSLITAIS